jgi:hypothetical protein
MRNIRRSMPLRAAPLSGVERMRRLRQKRRASGQRLVQLWVADTGDPRVAAELRAESRRLSARPRADELNWLDAVASDLDLPPFDAPRQPRRRRR